MKTLVRDPLLSVARGLLWLLLAGMAAGALGCLAGLVSLFAFGPQAAVEMAGALPGVEFLTLRWAATFVLVLVIGLLAMIARILWLLKRMVDTVGEGDPFVPENAGRLTRMAWLTLGIQLICLPIAGVATWLHKLTEAAGHDAQLMHVDGGFDMNGLLLMLVLFILARVFRKGAQMRADLDGTV